MSAKITFFDYIPSEWLPSHNGTTGNLDHFINILDARYYTKYTFKNGLISPLSTYTLLDAVSADGSNTTVSFGQNNFNSPASDNLGVTSYIGNTVTSTTSKLITDTSIFKSWGFWNEWIVDDANMFNADKETVSRKIYIYNRLLKENYIPASTSRLYRDASDLPYIVYDVASRFLDRYGNTSVARYLDVNFTWQPLFTGGPTTSLITGGTRYTITNNYIANATKLRHPIVAQPQDASVEGTSATSYVDIYGLAVRFSTPTHSTPTLSRSAKTLSWSADSNLDSGWKLEYTTSSVQEFNGSISLAPGTVSYTIPDELYYNTTIAGNSFFRRWRIRKQDNEGLKYNNTITGMLEYKNGSTSTGVKMPDYFTNDPSTLEIYGYLRSDYSNTLSVLTLSTPDVTATKTAINSYDVSWPEVSGAEGYEWGFTYTNTGTPSSWNDIGTTNEIELVEEDPYSRYIRVRAYAETVPSYYIYSALSTVDYLSFTWLNNPSSISFNSRIDINTAKITWIRPSNAIYGEALTYSYKLTTTTGTIITDWTDVGSLTTADVGSIPYGGSRVYVRAYFPENSDYDSQSTSYYTLTNTNMPKLTTPVLTKTDNYTLDEYGYNGVSSITISWGSNALLSGTAGTGFKITDSRYWYNEDLGYYQTDVTIDNVASTTTSKTYTASTGTANTGEHTYTVMAYFTTDTDYNSYNSSGKTASISESAPVDDLTWDTSITNIETKAIWTTAGVESYYIFEMNPDNGLVDAEFRNTNNKYYDVRTITGTPTIAESYTINVKCASYNRFYYHASENSNLIHYEVLKNGAPTNLVWTPATETLTWTAGTYNNYWTIYEQGNPIPLGTSETESFTVSLDASLHYLYVIGSNRFMVNDVNYNVTKNPTYIDSNISDYCIFGTLDIPVLTRTGNTLNWDAIYNPNGYNILYEVNDGDTYLYDKITTSAVLPTQSLGEHNYKIRAKTSVFVGETTYTFYSTYSNIITFTVVKLATPVILFNTDTKELYFDPITNATSYKLSVTGEDDLTLASNYTSTTPYVLTVTDPGVYDVQVQAINIDPFLFQSSLKSNTLIYGIYTLAAELLEQRPTITYNTSLGMISWSYIDNADTYTIYLNGEEYDTSAVNSYTFTLPGGSYNTYIVASNETQITNANPLYLDSAPSNNILFGVLGSPVATIDNNVISWSAIENAEYYEIYNFGELLTTIDNTSYTIYSAEPASFNIIVWAKSDSDTMDDSDSYSNVIPYTIIKLGTPVVNLNGALLLSWNPILSATQYEIYLNNDLITTTSATSLNMINTLKVGYNVIYVKAVSSLYMYLDSEISNTVRYTKPSTQQYIALIEGTKYEVWIPFDIKVTIDESLDIGSIVLAPISTSEPFEANTQVDFYVYGEDLDTILTSYNMIIVKDTVEEVQVGINSKWKHKLSLIELTKKLEFEIVPDISITQPLDYIKVKEKIYPTVSMDLGGNYLFNKTDEYTESFDGLFDSTISWINGPHGIFGGQLRTNYVLGNIISLPIESDGVYARKDMMVLFDGWYRPTYLYTYPTTISYYYRKYSGSYTTYDYNNNSALVLIRTLEPGNPLYWTPPSAGTYDIVMIINDYVDSGNDVTYKAMMNSTTYSEENMVTGRICWPGIEIMETIDLVDYSPDTSLAKKIGSGINAETGLYEVGALEKIVNILEPLRVVNGIVTKTKYTIDPFILQFAHSIPCPELQFENGKSLYEVLSQLGRMFYGIPRLKNGNVITFDILKTTLEANPLFEDSTELMNTSSTLENHSTGFISQASNLISDDFYSVYPMGTAWITPRSQSANDPYVSRDNMAIIVDKPINRIIDVKVKNFLTASPSTELSIVGYINEETIYNSLNSNADGKGLSLYYKDHDNIIYGLGIIPQASELYATLGWDATDYVIEKIILDLTNIDASALADTKEYQYKVWYKPYTDAKVFTERGNVSGFKNSNYKAFNQEDNTISDSNFGRSVATQIERLGNNDIQKNYRIYNITNIPQLGQIKVDNGFKYYADQISYTFQNNYIDVSVNYSKNINKINERVGIDAAYRQFRIYGASYVDRDININHYCYLSTDRYSTRSNQGLNLLVTNFKKALYDSGLTNPIEKPSILYTKSLALDHNRLKYLTYESTVDNLIYANVPAVALSTSYNNFKNSILISAEFMTNYSAGVNALDNDDVSGGTKKYKQKDVRYVDNRGELDLMNFTLCSPTVSQLEITTGSIGKQLPEAKYNNTTSTLTNAIFDGEYLVNKDNRERLRFNYQLHFKTFDSTIKNGVGLFKYLFANPIYDGSSTVTMNSPIWVLFKGDLTGKDSLDGFEIQSLSTPNVLYASSTTYSNYITISSAAVTANKNYDGYAYMWPETKEILFSVDTPITAGSYTIPTMYLNFSNKLLDYKSN